MFKWMISATTALVLFSATPASLYASSTVDDEKSDTRVSSAPAPVTEEKKETSAFGTAVSVGGAVLENVGGLEGIKTFASEYMVLAKEVEAKVQASQDERIKNGQTANKFTEIVARAKEAPTMIAFVGKKVILPFFKALFKFW